MPTSADTPDTPDAPDAGDPAGTGWVELSPPATLSALPADLRIHAGERQGRSTLSYGLRMLVVAFISSGFHMVACYRLGAFFHRFKLYPLSLLMEKVIFHAYHCVIPCGAQIGPGLWVPHPLGIVLSSRCRIGKEVFLRQHVEIVQIWPEDAGRTGIVGDRAQLNSGAILIRGALVGHDTVVAARALVNKPVPPRHLAIGMPAAIKPMKPEHFIHPSTPDLPAGSPTA